MHAILSRGLVGALRTNAPSPAAGNRISLHQNPGASTLDKTRIWRRSRFVMLASQDGKVGKQNTQQPGKTREWFGGAVAPPWVKSKDSKQQAQPVKKGKQVKKPTQLQRRIDEAFGKMLYNYYNWRTDTGSDLQLFTLFFVGLIAASAFLRVVILESHTPTDLEDYWGGLYEVLVLSFGQQFPDFSADLVHQAFSVVVAGIGLAAFALVLALVEQVVLEMIEANVARGSRVYETGHVLVLGWATSQRDLEVIWKTLEQLCYAYRNDGGVTVVVLTQRQKLEMEALFRRAIPEAARYGSRFVFRQGNPLVVADLHMVAAARASAAIVVSDASRCPEEADAQSLRCAILLDELDEGQEEDMMMREPVAARGHAVIEMKTSNAVPLLQYSCSDRFTPVTTAQLNARRLAKMVSEPFIATVSQQIMDYKNASNMFVQHVPEVVGKRFGDLAFLFDDAIVCGVWRGKSQTARLNCPVSYKITASDELIILRPTDIPRTGYKPQETPVSVPSQEAWLRKVRDTEGALGALAQELQAIPDPPAAPASTGAAAAGAVAGNGRQHVGTTNAIQQQRAAPVPAAAAVQPPASQPSPAMTSAGLVPGIASSGNGHKPGTRQPYVSTPVVSGENLLSADEGWRAPHGPVPSTSIPAIPVSSLPHTYHTDPSRTNGSNGAGSSSTTHGVQQGSMQPTVSGTSSSAPQDMAVAAAAMLGPRNSGTTSTPNPSISLPPAAAAALTATVDLADSSDWDNSGSGYSSGGEEHSSFNRYAIASDPASLWSHHSTSAASNSHHAAPHQAQPPPVPSWSSINRGPGPVSTSGASAALDVFPDNPVSFDAWAACPVSITEAAQAEAHASRRRKRQRRAKRSDLCGTPGSKASAAAARTRHIAEEEEHVEGPASQSGASIGFSYYGSASVASTDVRQAAPAQGGLTATSDQVCLADLGICVDPLREGGARAEQSSHPYLAFGSTRSSVEDLNEDEWEEAVELPSLPLSSTRKAASRKDDTGRSTSDGYMRPAGYQKATEAGGDTRGPGTLARAAGAMVRGVVGEREAALSSMSGAPSRSSGDNLGSKGSSAIFMVPIEYLVPDDRPKRVLVCGWGEQSFMRAVLRELDHGQMALPAGSEVVFANGHETEGSLGQAVKVVGPTRVAVSHVILNPLQRLELAQVGVHRFTAAICLCDEKWVDPDMDASNGVDELCQKDMLRLDSMVMMCQLNVRKLLEDNDLPTINIICQKVGMEGLTRFEDRQRLPLGISVNFTSFAAKLLTQAAYSPHVLAVHSRYGEVTDIKIVDASVLCAPKEAVSFWELMARAQALDLVLVGWYHLPSSVDTPMDVALNPQGSATRSRRRVWNKGNHSVKFVVLQNKEGAVMPSGSLSSTSSFGGSMDEEQEQAAAAMADVSNRQARWVRLKHASIDKLQEMGADGKGSGSGTSTAAVGPDQASIMGSMDWLPSSEGMSAGDSIDHVVPTHSDYAGHSSSAMHSMHSVHSGSGSDSNESHISGAAYTVTPPPGDVHRDLTQAAHNVPHTSFPTSEAQKAVEDQQQQQQLAHASNGHQHGPSSGIANNIVPGQSAMHSQASHQYAAHAWAHSSTDEPKPHHAAWVHNGASSGHNAHEHARAAGLSGGPLGSDDGHSSWDDDDDQEHQGAADSFSLGC